MIWENSSGVKPEGKSERRWFHRDLERWFVRTVTAVETELEEEEEEDEENERETVPR